MVSSVVRSEHSTAGAERTNSEVIGVQSRADQKRDQKRRERRVGLRLELMISGI